MDEIAKEYDVIVIGTGKSMDPVSVHRFPTRGELEGDHEGPSTRITTRLVLTRI